MANELMCIPNDDTQNYPSVDNNKWLKRLDITLRRSYSVISMSVRLSVLLS